MICKAKLPSKHPPGGFFHVVSFDENHIHGGDLDKLVAEVVAYYKYKEEEVPEDIYNLIVCQICYRSREWCIEEKSEGLGDTIAKFTRRTGLAAAHARVTGRVNVAPCANCGKRQSALNRVVKYKRTVK